MNVFLAGTQPAAGTHASLQKRTVTADQMTVTSQISHLKCFTIIAKHLCILFELSDIWIISEAFEFVGIWIQIGSWIYFKTMPDKYLSKSMRGVNMTLQKCQKKSIAKKFEFKFEFYLGFPENVFLSLSFAPGKMSTL